MVGMGSGNIIARSIGAGKREQAEKIASIAFFTGMLMGIFIAVFGTMNLTPIVYFLGATPTIAPYAEDYAFYILLAAPFMICSFIMNNLLRFQGKAFFCHVRNHSRRADQYGIGSHLHLYLWHGNSGRCPGHRDIPVH